ncbi:MAG: hypothetical protein WA664_07540, partial [Candidatus Acidiferrales bacterium]
MRIFALDLLLVVSLSISLGQTLSALPAGAASASATPPAIVIGFVGGFISHDNAVHGGVQLAAQLRKDYPSSVDVQVFENHHGEQAHQEILRLL